MVNIALHLSHQSFKPSNYFCYNENMCEGTIKTFLAKSENARFLFSKINKLKSKQSSAWSWVMWTPNFIVYNTNLRLGGIKFKVHVSPDGLRDLEWSCQGKRKHWTVISLIEILDTGPRAKMRTRNYWENEDLTHFNVHLRSLCNHLQIELNQNKLVYVYKIKSKCGN